MQSEGKHSKCRDLVNSSHSGSVGGQATAIVCHEEVDGKRIFTPCSGIKLSKPRLSELVGGIPTPLKNDGVRQLV